jgi:hypothetical protein
MRYREYNPKTLSWPFALGGKCSREARERSRVVRNQNVEGAAWWLAVDRHRTDYLKTRRIAVTKRQRLRDRSMAHFSIIIRGCFERRLSIT